MATLSVEKPVMKLGSDETQVSLHGNRLCFDPIQAIVRAYWITLFNFTAR